MTEPTTPNTWAIESKRELPAGTCSAYHVSPGKLPMVITVRAWVTEGKKTRLYRNGNCGIVRRFHCRTVEEVEEVVRYTDKLNKGTRHQMRRFDVKTREEWAEFRERGYLIKEKPWSSQWQVRNNEEKSE
jgi:hypothetical protein